MVNYMYAIFFQGIFILNKTESQFAARIKSADI